MTRPRGRPKKTAQERAQYERAIVDATRAVYAREGYHGLSVELILKEARIARPTFYRYFTSVSEPMEIVLKELNADLLDAMAAVLKSELPPLEKIEAALVAYRDWGARLGPMLRPLFHELHDAHSPTSRHRQRIIEALTKRMVVVWRSLGRAVPSAMILDTLLLGVEFLGYRYHLRSRRTAADWKATRDAMLRLAIGLLSNEMELGQALIVARVLGIDLEDKPRRRGTKP